MSDYKLNTRCVQGGYTPGNGEPRQIPIIQSTTFKYDTSEDMGRLFDLEAEGYFYTRLQNPTNDMVAAKIAELEGVQQQCLHLPDRLPTSLRFLTFAKMEVILFLPLAFTEEPLT